jgi:hypothetical protein
VALSEYYEKIQDIAGQLKALREIEIIYNQLYGATDHRVMKYKR